MNLTLPTGERTVKVSIISPNQVYDVPASAFLTPEIKGTTYKDTPCLSFLIEHWDATGKVSRVLFDLGIRKDLEKLPPTIFSALKAMDIKVQTEHDVADQLLGQGIDLTSIQAIIFSHWHFDHVGDATRFPNTTEIVVGPGFWEHCLPGYPTNPDSAICDDAFHGRTLQELDFNEKELMIASMPAIDWFGDGSFYILHTPGHAVGHISALARTNMGNSSSSNADTFMFLAGDVCHHAGELRPHRFQTLPSKIPEYVDVNDSYKTSAEYMNIHPFQCSNMPFYKPSCGGFNLDAEQMQETVKKVALLDSSPQVFVVLAHDHWILDIVDQFPKHANVWKEEGWADKSKWRFLQDFE